MKKKLVRILALLLCAVMIPGIFPLTADAEEYEVYFFESFEDMEEMFGLYGIDLSQYEAGTEDVPVPVKKPGDLNGNGITDDADVALLLWHTLFPEEYAVSGHTDLNADGAANDADVAFLLWHTLFPDQYAIPDAVCVNTSTRTVEPNCTEDGAVITYCVDCGRELNAERLPGSGQHSYTTKMNLATAVTEAAERAEQDNTSLLGLYAYVQNEDFDVMVCSGCGDIDINTMEFRYSDMETTEIMLGYINALREEAGVFPLEADPWLIEKAREGMTTYLSTGRAPSFNFPCNKFCVDGGNNIRHHFKKSLSFMDESFISWNYDYFAYVVGVPRLRENGIYCIMLLYSE